MQTEYGELLLSVSGHYVDEALVETTADAADRGGVTKVLSLEADVKTTGAELLEGEAEVSGKVNYRLLYLDRQERLCGLDYFKDFKCRVKGEEITPSGRCRVRFSVPDAEATLRGDEILLSAMVGVNLDYFDEKSEKFVTAVSEAETLKGSIPTQTILLTQRTVELEKVIESGPKVKKIVLFDTDALPVKVERRDGGNDLVGEVRVSVLYLNEADEVVEVGATIPFTESFEAGTATYDVAVKNARIVLTDDEGGGAIEVEATVTVDEFTYVYEEKEVLAAAVGECKEAIETLVPLSCDKCLGQHCYEQSLVGTIPVKEGGYVAFVRPGCHAIAEVSVTEGAVRVEGVAAFQSAVLSEGGYTAAQGELPFSYTLPFDGAKEGQSAEAKVIVTDAKGNMGEGGVAVSAKIAVEVTLFERESSAYLSDVTEGEAYPESEAGISVYFAEKGEDVWSIAKAMKALPSALVQANPFLEGALEENKKVLILRKK